MNANVFHTFQRALVLAVLGAGSLGSGSALARQAADVTGAWEITRDQATSRCRIMLNSEQSDKGDYFVGVPVVCRRTVPILGKVGRWSMPDADHLALTDPGGATILLLAADGATYRARSADGTTYTLVAMAKSARNVTAPDTMGDVSVDKLDSPAPDVIPLGSPRVGDVVPILTKETIAPKRTKGVTERPVDLAGRYAILRDKTHDTGCMLTLDDKTRVKGGERAALAPACRDQGIVVFDPSAWQIVGGRLVLTAKAGHTTHLDRQDDGTWLKDPGEGKSLSLKRL